MKNNKLLLLFLLATAIAAASAVRADGGAEALDRLMNGSGEAQVLRAVDGAIRITPDETRIIRLDESASSVVVANPEHAEVLLDSPRTLVIMPRLPGTTSFKVLDDNGRSLLEKTIIVATAARPGYVRVRRACAANDSACAANAYYYCPDGCYEVRPVINADGTATRMPEVPATAQPAPAAPTEVDAPAPALFETEAPTPPPPPAAAPANPEEGEPQ